jgi:macrolide transport system ATP-binding/permease protein
MTTHVLRDVHDAARGIRRAPGLSLVIVLTLALGIGVNAALFTLFRLFDRAAPGEIVRLDVHAQGAAPDYAFLSFPELVHLRDKSTTLASVAASYVRPVVVSGDASQIPPLVLGDFVSDTYFDVVRMPLARGRAFTRDEAGTPGRDAVAVLSHAFWQQYCGGRDDIVGRSIGINGVPFIVIGVAASDFVPPGFNWKADLWLPLTMKGRLYADVNPTPGVDWYDARSEPWLTPMARLAPGRTLAEARAEIRVLLRQLRDPRTARLAERIAVTRVTVLGGPDVAPSVGRAQGIATAATASILLIVCTNIAALLLARASAARKEVAIRLCLGASRGRLLRRALVESLVLTGIGGALGLLLAWGSLRVVLATAVFSALGREDLGELARLHVAPDTAVLVFTFGVSCVACLLFGLLPAWRATSGDLLPSVRDPDQVAGREGGRSRLRSGLIVAQAALSLMLLIAAGLLLRGLDRAGRVQPSVDPLRTVLLTIRMPLARYDAARAQQFFTALDERLRALPGVRAVARAESIPGFEDERAIELVGGNTQGQSRHARSSVRGHVNAVTPAWFEVIDPPLVRGRAFTDERVRGDAAVVSEGMARRLWPDRDAIGQAIAAPDGAVVRIVGVARDATDLLGEVRPILYVPLDPGGEHRARAHVLIRGVGDATALLAAVKTTAHAVDPALHMSVETMAAYIAGTSTFRLARTASTLAATLGALALVLASIGVYGVMAFMVSRRTREIGVRMALGADRHDVRRLVLGHGLRLGLAGVALGVAGGAVVARVLSSLLFGLNPFDPMAYVGASLLLLLIVLLACAIPTRRATRINPIVSLKAE